MRGNRQSANGKGLYIFIALLIFCVGLAVVATVGNGPIATDILLYWILWALFLKMTVTPTISNICWTVWSRLWRITIIRV